MLKWSPAYATSCPYHIVGFFKLKKIFSFKLFFFLISKVFIDFVAILLLLFYVSVFFFFFGPEACGILTPQPEIQPAPPALEGKVLTAGPPEESP